TAESHQPPRLTKERFVERTNDICFKHSQHQAKTVESYKRRHGYSTGSVPPVPFQEKVIVQIILPIVHETVAELEELRPPRTEEATLKAFLAALEKATRISEQTPRWLAEPSKEYEPYMPARLLAGKMGTYLCGQA
ncbi:MAG TPA: hypothetical protein VN733_06160, partial [Solirubrobacterales bacterium]|nr:hypothetical protein [Solirubrobacterales bacterium]